MMNRRRSLRDVLAAFAVLLGILLVAGAPLAEPDVTRLAAAVSDAESESDQPSADDADAVGAACAPRPVPAVGIATTAEGQADRLPLIARERGPPSAAVTVSTVTVLGA